MGYYRAGQPPEPAFLEALKGWHRQVDPEAWPEELDVPFPDPLAAGPTRLKNLGAAWRRLEESQMGYYRAGGSGSYGVLASDINPENPLATTEPTWGGEATITTPGRARQLARGQGYGRRYHRMNVGNVRALRRSMRRVLGFAHLARKVMTFTAHHKMKKHHRRK